MRKRRAVGLDLGQLSDFTALALLTWEADRPRPVYQCVTLKRWPLGTPYTAIAEQLAGFLALPQVCPAVLVMDQMGVGVAVTESVHLELLRREARGGVVGVTITAGHETHHVGSGRWRVPKKQLVSVLQVLLGQERLQVAGSLPEARTLLKELETFKVKVSVATGNESFEAWRERDHDDLVLAVALAAWAAETLDWSKIDLEPEPDRLAAW